VFGADRDADHLAVTKTRDGGGFLWLLCSGTLSRPLTRHQAACTCSHSQPQQPQPATSLHRSIATGNGPGHIPVCVGASVTGVTGQTLRHSSMLFSFLLSFFLSFFLPFLLAVWLARRLAGATSSLLVCRWRRASRRGVSECLGRTSTFQTTISAIPPFLHSSIPPFLPPSFLNCVINIH
jgi:hypothetical protein